MIPTASPSFLRQGMSDRMVATSLFSCGPAMKSRTPLDIPKAFAIFVMEKL